MVALLFSFSGRGSVIAKWTFNGSTPDANPDTGTTFDTTGASASAPVGGVTASIGSVAAGASSDPEKGDNSQLRITRFPALAVGNKTAGVQFWVSTVGYKDIQLTWDQYNSATASRYWRVQYTTNGSTWIDHSVFANVTASTWIKGNAANFSGLPGVEDNPNFGFRLVAEFEGTATPQGNQNYVAVKDGSNYSTAGTLWLDMMVLSGTAMAGPPANTPPAISELTNRTLGLGGSSDIPFEVSDQDGPADTLVVTASSSPSDVVTYDLGGSGSQRVITLRARKAGDATITIRVTDLQGGFAEKTFSVKVQAGNTAPQISKIPDRQGTRNVPLSPIEFTVSDGEQAAETLTISAAASNSELLPAGALIISGFGANRVLSVSPAANRIGTSIIELTVNDGQTSASTSFALTVLPSDRLAVWYFNGAEPDADPKTGSLLPVEGIGVFSLLGGVNDSFGTVGSGSNDSGSDNSMLRLATFPAQGTENKSAGFEVRVSTLGRARPAFIWQQYNSGSASAYWRFQYSTNGGDFLDYALITNRSAAVWTTQSVDLSGIPGADNNKDFAFRLVSEFESTAAAGTENYAPVDPGSNYSRAGTLWIDSLVVYADKADIPNSPPSISSIANLVVRLGDSVPPISFHVDDHETAAALLQVRASSSPPEAAQRITIVGADSERTLAVAIDELPVGENAVTIEVQDEAGSIATTSFKLTVLPRNKPPLISSIEPQIFTENASPAPISFTVADGEQSNAELVVAAESSNEALFSSDSLHIEGNGAERTLTFALPPANIGLTTVTLRVSDGSLTNETHFNITVLPASIVTIWDFNTLLPLELEHGIKPASGPGMATTIGSVFSLLSKEAAHTSDPLGENTVLGLSFFPSATEGNKTAGIEVRPAERLRNISVLWDQKSSAASSRYWRFQYTTNGSDFVDGDVITNLNVGWTTNRMVNLRGIPGVDGNRAFAFRFVAEFKSTATGAGEERFVAVDPAVTYSPSALVSLDMVRVSAELLPSSDPPSDFSISIQYETDGLRILWPVEPAGLRLEMCTALEAGDWKVSDAAAVQVAGKWSIQVPANAATGFFRLRLPAN